MPGDDLAVLPGVEEADGHKIAGVQGPRGVGIACECGRWQAFVTGLSAARWAGDDYRRHVLAETRGAPR